MTWDSEQILATLPHRYPFLLVDRILEIEEGHRAVGIKNVSFNEWFFQGHFPGRPIMPGVMILEALAQVGAVAILSLEGKQGRIPFFAGIDECRFRRPVVPGDVLTLTVELVHARSRVGRGKGVATVDGQTVAEATMLFVLEDSIGARHALIPSKPETRQRALRWKSGRRAAATLRPVDALVSRSGRALSDPSRARVPSRPVCASRLGRA